MLVKAVNMLMQLISPRIGLSRTVILHLSFTILSVSCFVLFPILYGFECYLNYSSHRFLKVTSYKLVFTQNCHTIAIGLLQYAQKMEVQKFGCTALDYNATGMLNAPGALNYCLWIDASNHFSRSILQKTSLHHWPSWERKPQSLLQ